MTAVVIIGFTSGTVGRMQLVGDPVDTDIQAAIDKTLWPPKIGTVVRWRRGTLVDFPTQHHDFRDAWRDDGTVISVDMPAARDIWRDKMRRARAPLLADLDVQFIRALEQGQPTGPITAQKQALRDVTADPALEAAKTPDELRAVWPIALGSKT
jgi:hypothetical protein